MTLARELATLVQEASDEEVSSEAREQIQVRSIAVLDDGIVSRGQLAEGLAVGDQKSVFEGAHRALFIPLAHGADGRHLAFGRDAIGTTVSMVEAPSSSIRSRSNPSATPVDGGIP